MHRAIKSRQILKIDGQRNDVEVPVVFVFQPASNDHAFRDSRSCCGIERGPAVDTPLWRQEEEEEEERRGWHCSRINPYRKSRETFGKVFGRLLAGDREQDDAVVNTGPPTTAEPREILLSHILDCGRAVRPFIHADENAGQQSTIAVLPGRNCPIWLWRL
jgi:hypothetical protein